MIQSFFRTWRFIKSHPLAARNQTGALGRWMRWQIGSRILKSPMVMPFVGDSVLVVEPGMTGATGNIYCGLHEFADMAFVLHVLRSDDLFLDIGANIGSYTVLAAKVAGANCLALEPVPETFAKLKRNLRVNDLGARVEALQCAAGSSPASLSFSADQDTTNRVVDENYPGKKIRVPVQRLDDLLAQRTALVWKVDVEGFERDVLSGASQALRQPALKAVLLEGDDPQIAATMAAAGFDRASYHPFTREIRAGNSAEAKNNNLWIRDMEFVSKRCRDARRIVVLGVGI
ncbi:MAG TPA: FkbM family methyltransferase [Verrucomicrobiae bacterium]|nr:FkbM family methyltransferase [Verrucomicrobiae bacterium]